MRMLSVLYENKRLAGSASRRSRTKIGKKNTRVYLQAKSSIFVCLRILATIKCISQQSNVLFLIPKKRVIFCGWFFSVCLVFSSHYFDFIRSEYFHTICCHFFHFDTFLRFHHIVLHFFYFTSQFFHCFQLHVSKKVKVFNNNGIKLSAKKRMSELKPQDTELWG